MGEMVKRIGLRTTDARCVRWCKLKRRTHAFGKLLFTSFTCLQLIHLTAKV